MNNSELNAEQVILEAAEAEFLEKGYGNAKTVAIARRAGMSHSMLHYYFRTKENLFQRIFLQKIQTLSGIFENIWEKDLPFAETLRLFMEEQFNFVAKNPQLPRFILNEVVSNETNRNLLFEVLAPKVSVIFQKFNERLINEVLSGRVRPITLPNLMMNIFSVNIAVFVALPMLQKIFPVTGDDALTNFLNERRESNVQFILNALKP
jgi:AcrR family transcriptional regulator